MIVTTVNIDEDLLKRLTSFSKRLGITQNTLITKIAEKMLRKNSLPPKFFMRVRYQNRSGDCTRKIFHIRLSDQVYEKCLDLRKVFKFSVSKLLSDEIRMSLDIVVKELISNKCKDNYDETYVIFFNSSPNGHDYKVYTTIHAAMKEYKT